MKQKPVYLLIALLTVFGGCKNGADSIPELSTLIFKALQTQDQKLFAKASPTTAEMEKAFEDHLPHSSTDKKIRKQEAINKAASVKLTLNQAFANISSDAESRKLEWKKTVILDMKYTLHDHKEDYKDASVRMILETNNVKNVIVYHAYLFGSHWYLMDGLGWEE